MDNEIKKELNSKEFIKKYLKNVIINMIITSIVIAIVDGFVTNYVKIPFFSVILSVGYLYFQFNNVWISAVKEIFIDNYVLQENIKQIKRKMILCNIIIGIVMTMIKFLPYFISYLGFAKLEINIFDSLNSLVLQEFITTVVLNTVFYTIITVFCVDVLEKNGHITGYKKDKYLKRKVYLIILCIIVFIWKVFVTSSYLNTAETDKTKDNNKTEVAEKYDTELENGVSRTKTNIESIAGITNLKITGTSKGKTVNANFTIVERSITSQKKEVYVTMIGNDKRETQLYVIDGNKNYKKENGVLVNVKKAPFYYQSVFLDSVLELENLEKGYVKTTNSGYSYTEYSGIMSEFHVYLFLVQTDLDLESNSDAKCVINLTNDEYIEKIHCKTDDLIIDASYTINRNFDE